MGFGFLVLKTTKEFIHKDFREVQGFPQLFVPVFGELEENRKHVHRGTYIAVGASKGKVMDFMALLTYKEPEKSPMFHLLSSKYRQQVANSLNRAILAHLNLPSYATMERLIQQATKTYLEE